MADIGNQNPFNTGSPARGDGFFDREDIIEDVVSFLRKTDEFNFLVFGQRRIGKTSFLRKLQEEKTLRSLAFPVYFNLQDKARTPLPLLLFEIAGRIALDFDLNLKVRESDFEGTKGPNYFKDIFLPAVFEELGKKKQLLLLFDEFDVLGDIDDVEGDPTVDSYASRSFIPFIVSLIECIQEKNLTVKFVFAIGRNYKDLAPGRYGQLTKFGGQSEISYFSFAEIKELLDKFSVIPFHEDAVKAIYDLTSGHPYFTQCLARAAFDNAEKKGKNLITPGMVKEEFIPTIKRFGSGVYWVWDSLDAQDQVVLYLTALLKEEKTPTNIDTIKEKAYSLDLAPAVEDLSRALVRLIDFKFLKEGESKPGNYDFYVEFLRKWIVRDVGKADIVKNLPELDEDIQHNWSNGSYYFRKKEYPRAIEHFEKIVKKSSFHFDALFHLARSYKNLIDKDIKNLEKSLSAYQKAYRLNPRKTEKEYRKLLESNRDYLEEKDIYKKYVPGDLGLIYELEKVAAVKIPQREIEEINGNNINGYALDEYGEVTGLSLNGIKNASLPLLTSRFKRLRRLALLNAQIRDISSLAELEQLTQLYLGGNQISDISPLLGLSHLTGLFLGSNRISDISPIKGLERLTELSLGYNQISDLGPLAGLKRFTHLYLGSNQISDISPLSGLVQLTQLYLDENQISDISPLTGLTKLRYLNVHGNQINDIAPLSGIEQLTNLYLGNNQISDISSLSKLKQLRELDLRGNQISDISSLSGVEQLIQLDLQFNLLIDITPLSGLGQLKDLNLGSNQISDIAPLSGLGQIIKLNLSSNQIKDIEPLSKLKSLTHVNLVYNRINELPETLLYLEPDFDIDSKLPGWGKQGFFFYGNPIETPPLEVVFDNEGRTNFEGIKNYFRQLERAEKDYLYEAKLLIVGEGGAGKTSLAKKIEDKNYVLKEEEPTTEGIDVIKWEFPLPGNKNFRVNIWDFGGQEIYHATHQFFLTKRSLYALVVDTRNEYTDFYYWLNVVELLSDNSPLLIIKNEKQDRRRQIDERQLRGQFTNLKDILAANLATNRGLPEILKQIKLYISNLPHIGTELPKTWVKVRETLENDTRNYISLDEYLSICAKNGFDRLEDKLQLSGYLHDLGVCLHFQDDPLLKRTVILNPTWGTAAVYKVLDNPGVINNLGKFNRGDLTKIWNEEKYAGMQDELLQLMINFKLCYKIKNSGDYIALQLLPANAPDYPWDKRHNLIMRYKYEFMPKGILSRFIVETHEFLAGQKYAWRSGIILQKEEAKAEVIEYYGKQEIIIRVSGRNKKELMTIVIYELDKINTTFKRIKLDKLIPCNCSVCSTPGNEPHFYRLENLKKRIRDRQFQVECYESYEHVEVLPLLDDFIEKDRDIRENEDSLHKHKASTRRTKVFISYAHKDKEWLSRVQKHLKALGNEEVDIDVWDDTRIKAGDKWKQEIKRALNETKIAILLISADFLASDFIAENELPPLLEAAKQDGAVILPLILKPSRYSRHKELSGFQAVNDPAKPLIKLEEAEQEEILVELANTIEDNL